MSIWSVIKRTILTGGAAVGFAMSAGATAQAAKTYEAGFPAKPPAIAKSDVTQQRSEGGRRQRDKLLRLSDKKKSEEQAEKQLKQQKFQQIIQQLQQQMQQQQQQQPQQQEGGSQKQEQPLQPLYQQKQRF